jgi:hypothetical protein
VIKSNFPDFVIVGAMKSGTTAIANILADLPDIEFSVPKEPSLLMRQDYAAMNQAHRVPPPDELDSLYAKCFAGAQAERLWGEGSTAYFADPDSPGIVTARNPDVRVIVLLRDPAERTRSAYLYSTSVFQEGSPTLEDAIEEELLGIRDNYWPNLRYLHYSNYPEHLRRWSAHIKPGHMLLLEFEDYVRHPESGIAKVCSFLGIPAPESLPARRFSNATVTLDSSFKRGAMRFLYTPNGIKSGLKPILPGRLRHRLKVGLQDRLAKGNTPMGQIDEAREHALRMQFAGMQKVLAEEFDFHPKYWVSGGEQDEE